MVLTASTMLPLGTTAPDFSLPDTITQKTMSLQQLKSDHATVIMFICNHCPFVKHIIAEIGRVVDHYMPKGIAFIAISANDIENYPEDSPENMKLFAEQNHFHFPYLYDASQQVAKAYQAACTPDFYIFDKNLACVYRGRFDASTPGKSESITGSDLRTALDCLLANKPVSSTQYPSQGCNIKWKSEE